MRCGVSYNSKLKTKRLSQRLSRIRPWCHRERKTGKPHGVKELSDGAEKTSPLFWSL